jgi:hypothetical protein
MQNGSIESFNGRFRDECLDPHWFRSLDEARRIIERWRVAYNETRPHTALRMSTPKAFAAARAATASASGSRAVSGLTAGAACRRRSEARAAANASNMDVRSGMSGLVSF